MKHFFIRLYLLLCLFVVAPSAFAVGEPVLKWTTGGPSGGVVFSLAGDAQTGILYAGTAHGIFVSRDWGATWMERSAGMGPQAVNGIALDAAGDAVAATNTGLYRKPANSLTWENVGVPGLFYSSVVVDANGIFYSGTYRSGVLVSKDRGATWIPYLLPAPIPAVFELAVDGSGVIYAGTRQGVYVHLPTDPSNRWSAHTLSATSSDVSALSATINPDGTLSANGPIYAGVSKGGVYVSTDRGNTWSSVSDFPQSFPISSITGLADGSVFISDQMGYYTLNAATRSFGRVAPYNWTRANVSIRLGNRVFLGTDNGILALSNGRWTIQSTGIWAQSVPCVAVTPDEGFIAVTRGGIYQSPDGGATWNFKGFTRADMDCITAGPNGTVYIGTRSTGSPTGILRSNDNGQSWKIAAGNNLPDATINALTTDQAGTLYAGTQQGVYKSTDQGENWTLSSTGIGPSPIADVRYSPDGALYACGRDGVYKSVDHGATWTASGKGIQAGHAESLSISSDGAIIYASSGANLFRSMDRGSNWELRGPAPDNSPGPLQVIQSDGTTLYATDGHAGIWTSTDGGVTWSSLSGGMGFAQVCSIALSPAGKLVAGTNGMSVWQTSTR